MGPLLIAILLGAGLVALVPTRQLYRRGVRGAALTGYFIVLWTLISVVIGMPIGRSAIGLLLVLAILPWLTPGAGLNRLLRRRSTRQPARNVTPRNVRARNVTPRNVTPPDA